MESEEEGRCEECQEPMERRRPWQRYSTECRQRAFWRRRLEGAA